MPTYLITGVAGFIASRTAEMLLDQGHSVVGIDNLNDAYDRRLKRYRLRRLFRQARGLEDEVPSIGELERPDREGGEGGKPGSFIFQEGDIEDGRAVAGLFAEYAFDAVLNLAARAGVRASVRDPHVYLTTNTIGTLNLLEAQRAHGVRKHVLASTSSLYAGCPLPFTEDLPVNTPISPYAASKKAAELMAYSYHKLHGIDVSVLRYFTVFGPAGRPDMSVFRFIRWIDEGKPLRLFGDGSQARDFTYVDDIARGTIAAARPVGYEIINLGGGRNPISLRALIGILEQQLGKRAAIQQEPFDSADVRETWADIGKARRLLDWKPLIAAEEGLARTVRWHLENRAWLQALAG